MLKTFPGFRRPTGEAGIRNNLLVIPTAADASRVAARIAQLLPPAIALPHEHGEAQSAEDLARTRLILAGLGRSPNVGAVLVVGVGQDQIDADDLAAEIGAARKPVAALRIHDAGGSVRAIQEGAALLRRLREQSAQEREPLPVAGLVLGAKCGGSDATSGLASNPALGVAADMLIADGGACVFGETPEIIGAEQVLARRAVHPLIGEQLYACTARYEAAVARLGVDMRGGNPTPGNIRGGLSSIEEKSLGAVAKGGSTPLMGVIPFATRPPGSGLWFQDSPGNDVECVTGFFAGGAQIVCFTTGRGTPTGSPSGPVAKLCANPETVRKMQDNIDIDLSGIILGQQSLEEAGARIYDAILAICAGRPVSAELLGQHDFAISRIGLTI